MNTHPIGKRVVAACMAVGVLMMGSASAVSVYGTWVFYDATGNVVGGKTIPCPPATASSWGTRGVSTAFHPLNCPTDAD